MTTRQYLVTNGDPNPSQYTAPVLLVDADGNPWSPEAGAVAWADVTGKPSTFTPATHTHNASDINAGTLALERIPTGTSGSTVALGNHTHAGLVAEQPAIADLTAAPTMENFNALLSALRAAGVIAE